MVTKNEIVRVIQVRGFDHDHMVCSEENRIFRPIRFLSDEQEHADGLAD